MLISEDFPTLDRPINAYSGKGSFGHLLTSELLIINSALCISMILKIKKVPKQELYDVTNVLLLTIGAKYY
jgi:hypothetical protein